MPSFDVVCEIDRHELQNAIDQANREVATRFDFKGANASFKWQDSNIVLEAEAEFQVKQMLDMLYQKASKRGLDLGHFQSDSTENRGKRSLLTVKIREGIDKDLARKLIKTIKESKSKVQAAIQGEQVRVTGKKRDDLQAVIALLKKSEQDTPLQFVNFRD